MSIKSSKLQGPDTLALQNAEEHGRTKEATTLARQNVGSSVWVKLIPLILMVACIAAYADSYRGVFILDDNDHIINEVSIRELFPLAGRFGPNDRRRVVTLSIILNYRYGKLDILGHQFFDGKLDVRGYHVFNIAIHLFAGLALYGIIRRTLNQPRFAGRFIQTGPWLAMTCALFWMLHPLQTQSVTYIIQRSESMMGMFYLLTLYCAIRASDSRHAWLWSVLSLASCALGMLTKEVMITAPVTILIYDYVFQNGLNREFLRRRIALYAGLLLPYLLLLAIGFADMFSAKTNVGFKNGLYPPVSYAAAETGVMLYYLRLCFWPHPLNLDYFDWVPPAAGQLWEQTWLTVAIVLTLVAASAWGVWKRHWLGFLGAWFFIILIPTSTFLPIRDLVMEHRLYLPLAAVVVLVVMAAYGALDYAAKHESEMAPQVRWLTIALIIATSLTMGLRTALRNLDYLDPVVLYRTVTEARPNNPRGWRNYAAALSADNIHHPNIQNRLKTAIPALKRALELMPYDIQGWQALAMMYVDLHQTNEAESVMRHIINMTPSNPSLRCDLGVMLNPTKPTEAEACFRKAIEIDPKLVQAHNLLAQMLLQPPNVRFNEAVAEFLKVIALQPNDANAYQNLGSVYLNAHRFNEAVNEYSHAIELMPNNPDLRINLGKALYENGRFNAAKDEFRNAQKLANAAKLPGTEAEAFCNLGEIIAASGNAKLAIDCFKESVQLGKDNPEYTRELAWALATSPPPDRDAAKAIMLAITANDMSNNQTPSFLDTLAAAYAADNRFVEAIATDQRALIRAQSLHQSSQAAAIDQHLASYKVGHAWTEKPRTR